MTEPGTILVTGARGQLGAELVNAFELRGRTVSAASREVLDVTDRAAVMDAVRRVSPTIVFNAAAYSAVDDAEKHPEDAFRVNAEGAGNVADAAEAAGVPVVHFSTDYVFDGTQSAPYGEDAATSPLNAYGTGKLAGEALVRGAARRHLIIRTSWLFSAHGRNFVRSIVRAMYLGDALDVVDDQVGCPTPAAGLASAMAEIAGKIVADDFDAWGTYHLCGSPAISRYHFAEAIFAALPDPLPFVPPPMRAVTTADRPSAAVRPPFSAMSTERASRVFGVVAPDWQRGLPGVVAEILAGFAAAIARDPEDIGGEELTDPDSG